MRNLLFILLFSVTSFISAEPVSGDVVSALKADDVTALSKFTTAENINSCYELGDSSYTPLALAIKAGARDFFDTLLNEHANIEKACASKTPLMYAVKYGNLAMTKALIKAGADHKFENSKGRTAKDYSKKYKQKEIYVYLKTL